MTMTIPTAEHAAVRTFNATNPVGTPVRYWRGVREGDGRTARTRTEAQLLSGHTAVVWLDGVAGCVALDHVQPIAEAELVPDQPADPTTATTTQPNPHPTPTRLDLLRNIYRRTVRREYPDRHPEYDYDFRAGRRVCARIAEAQEAGWVALDETRFSTGVHGVAVSYWRLTDAGRAVLAADTTPTRPHRDEPPLHRPVTTVHLPAADIA